jgi:hypothetical protein
MFVSSEGHCTTLQASRWEVVTPPLSLRNVIISRLKIMADLDISERRLPQDGRTMSVSRNTYPLFCSPSVWRYACMVCSMSERSCACSWVARRMVSVACSAVQRSAWACCRSASAVCRTASRPRRSTSAIWRAASVACRNSSQVCRASSARNLSSS